MATTHTTFLDSVKAENRRQQFCSDPATLDNLVREAEFWLESVSGFFVNRLYQGRNRLGRRSEPGSPVAWCNSGYSPDGTPFVRLTFSTFRHGREPETFDSSETLHQLWEAYRTNEKARNEKAELGQRSVVEARHHLGAGNSHNGANPSKSIKESTGSSQAQAKDEREQAKKAESVAADLALWASFATTGASGYLKRKGVSDTAGGMETIRYGHGFVAALITDVDGTPKGLQKIFDAGLKLFTTGLEKKGAFILLGTITPKHPCFYVCEGLATGLTIFQATGGTTPVVCALDAGNLEPVIKVLRKKYGSKSKCKIIIAADNDQWKALELNPQGQQKGNAGLTKAHQTALKHRCRVIAPNFIGLNTSGEPTDFNDLQHLAGIQAVTAQLANPRKPDPEHAFSKSRTKHQARVPRWFSGTDMVLMNERYIPDDVPDHDQGVMRPLTEFIGNHETIIVRSPIGTGKTELVRRFIEKAPGNVSVLYASHLVSLATDAAKRLNLELYSDYKGNRSDDLTGASFGELQRIAICLNSLPMLIDGQTTRRFDIVVIDEIEQLLRRLTTNIPNKRRVLEVLRYIIASADKVIVLDAHISPLTRQMLEMWRPGRTTLTLFNEYQIGNGRKVTPYDSDAEVMAKALEALKAGRTVFLAFNSKKAARQAFKLFESEAPGKRGLYLSADNSGDDENRAFFEDVNGQSKLYDFVVCSPSVSTGVSIDNGHFSFVGGIFTHAVNTPMDCMQALGRVRNMEELHVYISDAKNSLPTDETEIAARWLETHRHDRQMAGIGATGALELDAEYSTLFLAVELEQNFSRNDFLCRFLELLDADGYQISYHESSEAEAIVAGMLKGEAEELEQREYVETRAAAEDISDDDAQRIRDKHRRKSEETLALDKHEVKDFYRLPDDAPTETIAATIEQDKRGQLRTQTKALEVAVATDAQLATKYDDQDQAKDFIPDKRNFTTERELYRHVLEAVGIEPTTLEPDGQIYAKDDPAIIALGVWLTANRTWLQGVCRMPSDERLQADPLRFVSKILGNMGLKQHRTGRAAKGQYCVNIGQLAVMRGIVVQRGTLQPQREHLSLYMIEHRKCSPVVPEVFPHQTTHPPTGGTA